MGGHRASGAGDDLADGPVDLAAVRADDALLDAIAGRAGRSQHADYGFSPGGLGDPTGADDERIAAILAAWRADIEADPMPELVSLDEAAEAIEAGHEARDRARSRTRRRMPFAVAAAAALIAMSGFTVAVHGAMPGDNLWAVSKVFFAERAESVERVEEVRQSITEANAALERNDVVAARQALDRADVRLPQIEPEQRAPLETERDRVERSLTPGEPAPPPAPEDPAAGPEEPAVETEPTPPPADPSELPAPEATTEPTPPVSPTDETDPTVPRSAPTTPGSTTEPTPVTPPR